MADRCGLCKVQGECEVYCDACAAQVGYRAIVQQREDLVRERVKQLGWSSTWCGPTDERWAILHCYTNAGWVQISVDLSGQVRKMSATLISASDLARLFAHLAYAFR